MNSEHIWLSIQNCILGKMTVITTVRHRHRLVVLDLWTIESSIPLTTHRMFVSYICFKRCCMDHFLSMITDGDK